ncbi:MAG TPA: hypothetical protein VGG00_09405, partial [Rhodanobacter sp.]
DSRPSVTSTSPNTCLSLKRTNALLSDLAFPRGEHRSLRVDASRPPRALRVPRGSTGSPAGAKVNGTAIL